MFTTDPVDIEPLEFEYKYDRTGRKYIVAKKKNPMNLMKKKTYILSRTEPHSPISRMVFTISYNDRDEPQCGSVMQQCDHGSKGGIVVTDFVWVIDGVEYEFAANGIYSTPLLRRLWIDMKENRARAPHIYVEEMVR